MKKQNKILMMMFIAASALFSSVEVDALMGGGNSNSGNSNNSSGNGIMGGGSTTCNAFVSVRDMSINKVVTVNGIKVPYSKQFNSCAGKIYTHYTTGGQTNLFFRRNYGDDLVAYSHIPDSAYRNYSDNRSQDQFYEKRSSGSFKTWAVKFNTTYCGTGLSTYMPGYLKAQCPSEYLDSDLRTYKSFSENNGFLVGVGSKGEARYIGYASNGEFIDNTYFPMDAAIALSPGDYPYDDFIDNKTNFDNHDNQDVYSIKISAIRELLAQESTMMAKSSDPHWWAKRLSLRNDPQTEPAVFRATRDNGSYYMALIVKAKPEMMMNVGITKMVLRDKDTNEQIAVMTRNVGEAAVNVSFTSGKKLEMGTEYLLDVTVTNGSKKATNVSSQYILIDGKSYSKGGSLGAGQSTTIKDISVKTSEDATSVEIVAEIDDAKYGSDNQFLDDDIGMIKAPLNKPATGDLYICGIQLYQNGKETSAVVMNKLHTVKYSICYNGQSQGDKTFDIPVVTTTSSVTSTGGGMTTVKIPQYDLFEDVKLDENTRLEVTVPITPTTPEIKGEVELVTDDLNSNINKDTSNDEDSHTFKSNYNIAISNLKVLSPAIQNNNASQVTIQYDLSLSVPKGVSVTQAIKTKVTVGGQVLEVSDTVTSSAKTTHTHTLNLSINAGSFGDSIPIEVFANKNKQDLIESSYADNLATTDWNKMSPSNSVCGITVPKNTSNEWQQKLVVQKKRIEFKPNASLGWDETIETNLGAASESVFDQREDLAITSIRLRSKLMKDLNVGNEGWVDVLNGGSMPRIKAGYGFEIEIDVQYTTDAFREGYKPGDELSSNQTGPKTWEVEKVIEATKHEESNLVLGAPDIFIKTQDNKIFSATGYNNSFIALEAVEVNKDIANGTVTWKYRIKEHTSPYSSLKTDRLYIGENTKDGLSEFYIYTPSIPGLQSRASGQALCDAQSVQFEVKGSVYDDLNTHITN